jgi:hypothetical protein
MYLVWGHSCWSPVLSGGDIWLESWLSGGGTSPEDTIWWWHLSGVQHILWGHLCKRPVYLVGTSGLESSPSGGDTFGLKTLSGRDSLLESCISGGDVCLESSISGGDIWAGVHSIWWWREGWSPVHLVGTCGLESSPSGGDTWAGVQSQMTFPRYFGWSL